MVHFLQFVHLFCCSSSTKFLKPESAGSILALNHNIFMLPKVQQVRPKGPPLGFFGTMRLFFENFRILSKGNPLHFFEVFCLEKRLMSLNGLFLSFSALCDFLKKYFFSKKKISIFFENNFSKCFQ